MRPIGLAILATLATLAALGRTAAAQTILEIEPNDSKAMAFANGSIYLYPGATLVGSTTGSPSAGSDPIDTFLVHSDWEKSPDCFLCRHVLDFTTSGHVVTIRGLEQVGGVLVPNSDSELQLGTSIAGSTSVVWYGFEPTNVYVSVAGTTAATLAYSARLWKSDVLVRTISPSFVGPTIRISTMGLTAVDTEMFLYDPGALPVPGAHNDDQTVDGTTTQSDMTRTLAPGWYTLVIGPSDLCNDQSDGNADENDLDDPVLDFPNGLVTRELQPVPLDLDFSITDATGTRTFANPGEPVFGMTFWTFEVTAPAPDSMPYCFGDGTGAACPCANQAPGNAGGCFHSLAPFGPQGGTLRTSGTPSVTADTLVLEGSLMTNSFCLYFQGTTQSGSPPGNGTVLGDGKRCAGGSVVRIGTKLNVLGASRYPETGDAPIWIRGLQPPSGSTRTYQAWFRNNASFCTPDAFNLTNGQVLTWRP